MEVSNSSEHELLQMQSEIFGRLLPEAAAVITLAAIGAVGNIIAAVFYTKEFKRTTTLNLIIALTLNDFVVCILLVPNFVEMRLNVNNSFTLLCKATHFLNQLFVGVSCILLGVISIDRYRRICKPFGKQIPTSALKYIIPLVFFLSSCSAIRKILDYDTIEVVETNNTLTVSGYFCTNTNDPDLQLVVSTFYILDLVFVLTIWIIVIVAYSKAIHTVTEQRRKDKRVSERIHFHTLPRGPNATGTRNNDDAFERIVIDRPAYHIYGMDISENSIVSEGNDGESLNVSTDTLNQVGIKNSPSGSAKYLPNSTSTKRKTQNARKVCKKPITKNISRLEQNLTYMMFSASVIFLLSFAPFFIVKLITTRYFENIPDYELRPGIQFTLKLPLVNSVCTPIIYSIFNSKFRRFLKPKCCKF